MIYWLATEIFTKISYISSKIKENYICITKVTYWEELMHKRKMWIIYLRLYIFMHLYYVLSDGLMEWRTVKVFYKYISFATKNHCDLNKWNLSKIFGRKFLYYTSIISLLYLDFLLFVSLQQFNIKNYSKNV